MGKSLTQGRVLYCTCASAAKPMSLICPCLHFPGWLESIPATSNFRAHSLDYMEFRLWIGLHSAFQCLVLVAADASFIVKYITRFTEEGFSMLISFIFIYDALKKMIGVFRHYPINVDFKPNFLTMYKCDCIAPNPGEW